MTELDEDVNNQSQSKELNVFLFLTVVMAPIMSVLIVGGYGLFVWIFQMFAGPPTH